MAVTPYTEATFKNYLFSQLAETLRATIGWASTSDPALTLVVDDTLLVLDVADITTLVTSGAIAQLRAVGRYMLWRAALQWLVTQYDVTVDGSTFKRSQLLTNLKELLRFAYDDAIAAGVSAEALPPAPGSVNMPAASIGAIGYDDPYSRTGSVYGIGPLDRNR
jgi:hypothetical protein